ncbi:MAG: GNAT family N-acetyltransferase, partial [Sphingomonadales bacterium]
MISFRQIDPADFERVFDIWHRSVLATHDFLSDEDRAEIATQVKDLYIPNAPLILAVRDDVILGFMGMTDNHIDALFIDPDYLGQGIGKAFIQHARTITKGPLSVDVNEQNEDAH